MYAAPTLWNILDLNIRLLPFDSFNKIKVHLYLEYFVDFVILFICKYLLLLHTFVFIITKHMRVWFICAFNYNGRSLILSSKLLLLLFHLFIYLYFLNDHH